MIRQGMNKRGEAIGPGSRSANNSRSLSPNRQQAADSSNRRSRSRDARGDGNNNGSSNGCNKTQTKPEGILRYRSLSPNHNGGTTMRCHSVSHMEELKYSNPAEEDYKVVFKTSHNDNRLNSMPHIDVHGHPPVSKCQQPSADKDSPTNKAKKSSFLKPLTSVKKLLTKSKNDDNGNKSFDKFVRHDSNGTAATESSERSDNSTIDTADSNYSNHSNHSSRSSNNNNNNGSSSSNSPSDLAISDSYNAHFPRVTFLEKVEEEEVQSVDSYGEDRDDHSEDNLFEYSELFLNVAGASAASGGSSGSSNREKEFMRKNSHNSQNSHNSHSKEDDDAASSHSNESPTHFKVRINSITRKPSGEHKVLDATAAPEQCQALVPVLGNDGDETTSRRRSRSASGKRSKSKSKDKDGKSSKSKKDKDGKSKKEKKEKKEERRSRSRSTSVDVSPSRRGRSKSSGKRSKSRGKSRDKSSRGKSCDGVSGEQQLLLDQSQQPLQLQSEEQIQQRDQRGGREASVDPSSRRRSRSTSIARNEPRVRDASVSRDRTLPHPRRSASVDPNSLNSSTQTLKAGNVSSMRGSSPEDTLSMTIYCKDDVSNVSSLDNSYRHSNSCPEYGYGRHNSREGSLEDARDRARDDSRDSSRSSSPSEKCIICRKKLSRGGNFVKFCNFHFCNGDRDACFQCSRCRCPLNQYLADPTNEVLTEAQVISNGRGSIIQCGNCVKGMGLVVPRCGW